MWSVSDQIGTVGTGMGHFAAHLHFAIWKAREQIIRAPYSTTAFKTRVSLEEATVDPAAYVEAHGWWL